MSWSHLQADPQGLAPSMRPFIEHLQDSLRVIVDRWANQANGMAEQGDRLKLHHQRVPPRCSSLARIIGELRPLGHRVEIAKMVLLKKNVGVGAIGLGLWFGWGLVFTAIPAAEVGYSSDQYWIGKGQGDLTKGKAICQRVSELSARTDLAKQIRVLVKEHMIDRVRERAGRESEQDIELTREEIVQEYLQDVKIVDRRIDEENKICTATAVMPKRQVLPKFPDHAPSPSDTHQ